MLRHLTGDHEYYTWVTGVYGRLVEDRMRQAAQKAVPDAKETELRNAFRRIMRRSQLLEVDSRGRSAANGIAASEVAGRPPSRYDVAEAQSPVALPTEIRTSRPRDPRRMSRKSFATGPRRYSMDTATAVKAIRSNPHDINVRGPMADFLEENDLHARPETLSVLREHPGPVWAIQRPDGKVDAGPHLSVADIRDRMTAAGSHWWTPATMRSFGTRVGNKTFSGPGGTWFVTSDHDFQRNRGFSLRHYDPSSGDIQTVGEMADTNARRPTLERLAARFAQQPTPLHAWTMMYQYDPNSLRIFYAYWLRKHGLVDNEGFGHLVHAHRGEYPNVVIENGRVRVEPALPEQMSRPGRPILYAPPPWGTRRRGQGITHADLHRWLGRRQSRNVDRNKVVHRDGDDIIVTLHRTPVVRLHPDGTFTLRTGGWNTPTTRRTISNVIGFPVRSVKNKPMIGGKELTEGMRWPELPQAPEVDYRPSEMIPEDYYSFSRLPRGLKLRLSRAAQAHRSLVVRYKKCPRCGSASRRTQSIMYRWRCKDCGLSHGRTPYAEEGGMPWVHGGKKGYARPVRYSHEAFGRKIAEVRDSERNMDTTPSLVYADWLEENGMPIYAGLIRHHIENHGPPHLVASGNRLDSRAHPMDRLPPYQPTVAVDQYDSGGLRRQSGNHLVYVTTNAPDVNGGRSIYYSQQVRDRQDAIDLIHSLVGEGIHFQATPGEQYWPRGFPERLRRPGQPRRYSTATESDFHAAMHAEPNNSLHPLVYADWLEENGKPGHAEVIRRAVEHRQRHGEPPVDIGETYWDKNHAPGRSIMDASPDGRGEFQSYFRIRPLTDPQSRMFFKFHAPREDMQRLLQTIHDEGGVVKANPVWNPPVEGQPHQYEAYRAPAGGSIVRGLFYKGGSLIPDLKKFAPTRPARRTPR